MNKFKLMLALLAAPSMVLASCGGDPAPVVDKKVTKVSVTCSKTTLQVGGTVTAKANVNAEGGADTKVSWKSSNEAVATVSSSGKITAIAVGKATITATSTFDDTKSDSVEITVVAADWSAADKEMMEEYLGEVVPYFPGAFTWTDAYYDYYQVLSAESDNLSDLDAVVAQFKADSSFEHSYDEEYECDTFIRDSAADPLYDLCIDVYVYEDESGKIATVDAYVQPKSYDEWPTEVIASLLEECGFDIALPAYTARDPGTVTFMAQAGELEEGGNAVLISASGDEDATDTAEDYVHLFSTESYKVDAYDDGYGGSFYLISDNAKTVTIQVANVYDIDWEIFDIVQYPGFEVMVMDYIPDYSLELLPAVDMIEVGNTLTMDVVKGEDFKAEDVITFTSSDATVATVSAEGVVTGVKAGEVQITAAFGDESSAVSTIYVVDAIPTAFTQAQLDEFDKIHPGKDCAIPFNKYFTSVKYDETEKYVSVTGLEIDGEIMESIYAGMIAGGWTDVDAETYADYAEAYDITVDEARIELYEYYGYYSFTKLIEDKYLVGADLYIMAYDEYYEEDVMAFEGNVHVDVYDDYIYSYADAKSAIGEIINDLGIETTASFPDSMPGNRFAVEYDGDYNMIFFDAYNVGDLTLAQVVEALGTCGWDAEVKHEDSYVDEDSGETVPAVDYVSAVSKDEVLELEATINDGDISFYVFLPSMEVTDSLTIDDLLPDVTKATIYTDFTDVEGDSGAVYAGQCALSDAAHGSCIQIRSKNSNSGIYSAESAGSVVSVTINFNEATTSTKQIKIVASNEPFDSTEDLYSATVVGTVTNDEGVGYYEFEEDYAYFGIISADGAFYIDSIDVVWLA